MQHYSEGEERRSYLFFLVPLLAQILAPPRHLRPPHRVLLRREVLLLLRLVRQRHQPGVRFFVEAPLAAREFAEVRGGAAGGVGVAFARVVVFFTFLVVLIVFVGVEFGELFFLVVFHFLVFDGLHGPFGWCGDGDVGFGSAERVGGLDYGCGWVVVYVYVVHVFVGCFFAFGIFFAVFRVV
jgi:hypothetical protein